MPIETAQSQMPANLACQGGTATFVMSCILYYVASHRDIISPRPELLSRAIEAMDFLIRSQRDSGLIDLKNCNYNSAPDTAFIIQGLLPLFPLISDQRPKSTDLDMLCKRIETFAQRATNGLITGGFHTPNHRWVIASALALAIRFTSPPAPLASRASEVIDALLAETIDIDSEGTFIERSVGTYDAVCDRSLLFLEECWPGATAAGAAKAAIANLKFDLYLFDKDGTAETGLSRRQDYGTRSIPFSLVSCYLLASRFASTSQDDQKLFTQTALFLLKQAQESNSLQTESVNWLTYAFLRTNLPPLPELFVSCPRNKEPEIVTPLSDFCRYFPINGFWRARRDDFSATVFTSTSRLLHLCFGKAELAGLKISQSYFGAGQFVGQHIKNISNANDTQIVLIDEGQRIPRRPGYELPLGTSVPKDDWERLRPNRPLHEIAPAASELEINLLPNTEISGEEALELVYRTRNGLDGVTAQLALDFAPGGIWETNDTITHPIAGQTLFLKSGKGRMRYGSDVIEIDGAAHAHTTWLMRDSETAPKHVRVLLTFLTPIEHRFQIKAFRQKS